MYKLPYYTEPDEQKVLSFMQEHSFAIVTGHDGEFPAASQLPLEIEHIAGKLFLSGHLMKKTGHYYAFKKNEKVLVIFNSPYAYVNAGWYSSPAVGSTVNYIAVHITGKISFTDDEGTREAVKKITDRHIGEDSPASFKNLSTEYVDSMIQAIAGFSIEVLTVENVFKLSQNRNLADRENIVAHLDNEKQYGADFIAEEMRKRLF